MNAVELVDALREIDFLAKVGDEHLEKIASVAQLVEIPAGKMVFRHGEPAKDIYLIVHGNVSLEICAPGIGCRRIHTVGQGELLGWSPLLAQPRLTATARTLAATQAVKINGNQILTLCEHDPAFGYAFMRGVAWALAKRLSAMRIQFLDVYGEDAPAALEE